MIGLIIPALDPPKTLPDMVRELAARLAGPIVVINDGSGSRTIFDRLEAIPNVAVLHHEENRGKGEALKTGFRHLLREGAVTGMVTLDADGQHLVRDVVRICREAEAKPQALILGARSFDRDVPLKSILGNRLTKWVLGMFTGLGLGDTQTGLRFLPRPFADACMSIAAARYEFELEMLFLAKKLGVELIEVPIATVYIDQNRATHFRAIRDSINIYMVFVRFSFISLTSFFLDVFLFALIHHFTEAILVSTYAARLGSGTYNLLCNRSLVFRDREAKSLVRDAIAYTALAISIATISGHGVRILSQILEWSPVIVKIIVDPCIFLISFMVQRYLIFRR